MSSDVVIYGATGAGFVAAVAASRTGCRHVTLISTSGHVGGMLTSGLQHTDSANASVIGGITREFFERVEMRYPGRPTNASYPPGHKPPGWLFESHVAQSVLNGMLAEANVSVVRHQLGLRRVVLEAQSVRSIETDAQRVFAASVFIDASYEGDLVATAAGSVTWGRESAAQYRERSAGRRPGVKPYGGATVNPYWNATARPLRVLPHVALARPVGVGQADRWIEAYDFRLCMTNSPGYRVPIERPDDYNASEWEFWRRVYGQRPPRTLAEAGLYCLGPIPNSYGDCGPSGKEECKKCDMLGETDLLGGSWGYVNGTAAARAAIWQAHLRYTRGLLWFWSSDAAVPHGVRSEIGELGHCRDEYDAASPPHWPPQLYVREARRVVGDFVWTEWEPPAAIALRTVGLGSYTFDCHWVSRVVHTTASPTTDYVVAEGRVNNGAHGQPVPGVMQTPFVIPYDVMVPKARETTNVLVPVAISATHIRFNAIRMEPTWMILGHAAGVAAAMLANESTLGSPPLLPVQSLDVIELQQRLKHQHQRLRL